MPRASTPKKLAPKPTKRPQAVDVEELRSELVRLRTSLETASRMASDRGSDPHMRYAQAFGHLETACQAFVWHAERRLGLELYDFEKADLEKAKAAS